MIDLHAYVITLDGEPKLVVVGDKKKAHERLAELADFSERSRGVPRAAWNVHQTNWE